MTEAAVISVLTMLLVFSLLVTLVLALRVPVARWLGPGWAYRLWVIPLVGLLAAMLPGESLRRTLAWPAIEIAVVEDVVTAVTPSGSRSGTVTRAGQRPQPAQGAWTWFALAWGLGATSWIIVYVARCRRSRSEALAHSRELSVEETDAIRALCPRLLRMAGLALRKSSNGDGPSVQGPFGPVLLLPADFFVRYSERQQALMLAHEHVHLRRGDLLVLLVADLLRGLLWINPLAHWAARCLRIDQELSADEDVLQIGNTVTRRTYGETLLLTMQRRRNLPLAAFHTRAYAVARMRLSMLGRHHERIVQGLLGSMVLATALAGAVLTGLVVEGRSGHVGEIRDGLAAQLAMVDGIMLQTGDPADAIRRFRKVAQDSALPDPVRSQAFEAIAGLEFSRERFSDALRALRAADLHDLGTTTPSREFLRSQAQSRLGNWDLALAALDRALDAVEAGGVAPEERWLLSQAALRWKLGDLDGAARSLDRAMETHPDIPHAQRVSEFDRLVRLGGFPTEAEPLGLRN